MDIILILSMMSIDEQMMFVECRMPIVNVYSIVKVYAN